LTEITSDKLIVGPWVAKKTFGIFNPDAAEAIGLRRHGEMVAGVVYESWNGASMVVHIAVQGLMTPSYLAAIYHYPFVHVGVNKLIAPISEGNKESIRFVTKMGFKQESRIPDAHPDGALLLYTMARADCKYIKENYSGKLFTTGRSGDDRRSYGR
jgi:RimJ/RimL family protein N-acetyltransferase